jgi:DNA gyrase subunit A
MASDICSFNLAEICDGTIAILKKPNITTEKIMEIIKAPDFPGGGQIIYDYEQMKTIYETGDGSFKIRSRYSYDKKQRCIDILQIPYSTSIEQIQKALTDLYKEGKLKEISDFRDEIDLNGFKLTLDLRSGVDPDALMAKLYKLTPLESSFGCNFNVLIDGSPRQMGVIELLSEWIRFRIGCLRREFTYDLEKKREKLHLLQALGKILLDIDKAIRIVRETEKESEVVPRLMEGFSIDEPQAEYIAEIKLRHLNREYILNRLTETTQLQKEIADLEALIADDLKIKAHIVKELMEIKKKYAKPRKTQLIDASEIVVVKQEHLIENYGVKVVFTKGGYLKKITYRSLQGNSEHRLKDGDYILSSEDAENRDEILFLTNRAHLFRAKLSDFEDSKASEMGEYVATKLGFEPDEKTVLMKVAKNLDSESNFVFIFENGKAVRVPLSAYETKSVRRKLTNAYSEASPLVAAFHEDKTKEIVIVSSDSKAITIKSSLIAQKSTRTASGATVFNLNLKKGQTVAGAYTAADGLIADPTKYRKIKVPAAGVALTNEDKASLADKL